MWPKILAWWRPALPTDRALLELIAEGPTSDEIPGVKPDRRADRIIRRARH